jgi:hypothetical protein
MGCCLLGCLAAAGPRVAFVFWWFLDPARVKLGFGGSWIWPILGVLVLPWTTLMYMLVFPGGLSFVNWIFLALAFAIDLGTWFGNGEAGRRKYSS